ncbi:MAG: hypothetical protein ACT4TC_25365 [Myxococcaceae bacterium]
MKVRSVVMGVAVVFLSGCSHTRMKPSGPAEDVARYYPLALGNRWTYDGELLGEKRQQTVEIVGREKGFFRDSQGGELIVDSFGLRDKKRYLLREPLEAGKEWTNVVSVSSVEHYRVLDAGVSCEVPAGKFEGCLRVEGRNRVDAKTTLVNEFTFAPNVGIVQISVSAETGGRRIPQAQLKLRDFKLARAE